MCPGGGICGFGILNCCRMKMSSVPLHNYTDSLRYGHMKLTHQTNFYWDGMGMLRTLLGHNNTWHVSLEPKMAFPGVRIVIGSILSALLAWKVFRTLFRRAHIAWLLAGEFGCSSDLSCLHVMLMTMPPIDLVPFQFCDITWHTHNLAILPSTCNKKNHREKMNPCQRKWRHWIRRRFSFLIASWIL